VGPRARCAAIPATDQPPVTPGTSRYADTAIPASFSTRSATETFRRGAFRWIPCTSGSHRPDHLERDGEPLVERSLRARGLRTSHPLDDLGRDGDAGHLVGQELGAAQGGERPHARDDGRAVARRQLQEGLELRDVEDRLRDREICAGLELVREALELVLPVLRALVHRHPLHEARGCADGGTTRDRRRGSGPAPRA
jgi:hypothetical protein